MSYHDRMVQPRWLIAALLAIAMIASGAVAQQRVPGQSRELRQAVRALTQEARDVRATGMPEGAQPDFAARHDGELAIETIQNALAASQHRDPFIDAYIRWQLLSFQPPFPELDDRAFLRLLRNLPALVENPRGEQAFMELVARAEKMDALSPGDFDQLRQLDELRSQQMHLAESLNRPAMAIREWIRAGSEDSPVRTLQSMVEECAATIDGAWPPRDIKGALTQTFTRAAGELGREEKRLLAEQTQGLVGKNRRFVNSITFFADRSINVSYARAQVTQRDFDRWMERLAGDE